MAILTTHNLAKYFGEQDIFAGLNLKVHHGDRIALIGRNGTGKTTLLQILAGQENPTSGNVWRAKNTQVGYLDQHASLVATAGTLWELALTAFETLRQQEAELQNMEAQLAEATQTASHEQLLHDYGEAQSRFEHAGGYNYEQTIDLVLTGLGFKKTEHHLPVTQLSGGQQSRAQLARLLLERPQMLLLDEPTNHLDLASVEWLESYLQNWDGSLIVVSHDRYFLDKVSTLVWELTFGEIESYRGNFSHYVTQRAERLERRQKEYEAQQAFIQKEQEFIQRNLAGQRTKEAQGRRKRLARLERVDRVQTQNDLKLNLQPTLRSGDLVLATHDLVVGYQNQKPLFRCPDLEIRRGDCIAVLGPNGAGKTTFVKTIVKQLDPKAGAVRLGTGVKIGYFAQTHASLNLKATILDELLTVRNLPLAEARNYLGRYLFQGDDVFRPIGALSGGERSRVALAKLSLTGANFLILDEPTNHLDISSQENLEDVLEGFDGTTLLVSHDRYFVDALANFTWAIDPTTQSLQAMKGGYTDYLTHREADQAINGTEPKAPQKAKQSREQTKAQERAARQRAKQIAEIEATITQTEAGLAKLAEAVEIASQAQDVPQLQRLGQDYQEAEKKLEELLVLWTELETETP